jgi:hypothetical protein
MGKETKTSKSSNTLKDSNRSAVVKFQTLSVNKEYMVMEISKPIKGKYGTSYILKIKPKNSDMIRDIWTTKSLARYIDEDENRAKKNFYFTVKLNDAEIKYPEIRGYNIIQFTKVNFDSDSE